MEENKKKNSKKGWIAAGIAAVVAVGAVVAVKMLKGSKKVETESDKLADQVEADINNAK